MKKIAKPGLGQGFRVHRKAEPSTSATPCLPPVSVKNRFKRTCIPVGHFGSFVVTGPDQGKGTVFTLTFL
uniref:Uncharacterized protein n=1 Tax=Candidatus Methanogaster sp. ANME-2c ERB4 TaxID=2759911 RepID=A0A7G9Y321_9EURY|nr:hypothetical protein MIJONALH_00003 [Methanosarcinales archaeon ANME-2c ERB4]